jgi:hypothetical protein
MATTRRIEERKEAVERRLQMKNKHIEGHLEALQEEVTTIAPSIGKAIFEHPLVSVGGALVAGLAVGLIFGGRKRAKPDLTLKGTHRVLVERYLDALIKETRYRVAKGAEAGEAVHAALADRVPLIVYEGDSEKRPGVLSQSFDMIVKTALGFGVKLALDYITSIIDIPELLEDEEEAEAASTIGASAAVASEIMEEDAG